MENNINLKYVKNYNILVIKQIIKQKNLPIEGLIFIQDTWTPTKKYRLN